MKSFEELAALRERIQQRERDEARTRAEAQAAERRRKREADTFALALNGVVPLQPHDRHQHRREAPPPIARQHERDESCGAR